MALDTLVFNLVPAADGNQRSIDPDGNYMPSVALPAPTNLRVVGTPTTDTINLAWTMPLNIRDTVGFYLEMRETLGEWEPAPDPIHIASIREASMTGLATDHEYQFRVFGFDQEEIEIPPPETLPNLAPTRVPMDIVSPGPDLPAGSRQRLNHSSMPYVVPVIVVGGKPPFTFAISGIATATITPRAPEWNPAMTTYAEINMPANTAGTYRVTVTDQDGVIKTRDVAVVIDDDAFTFVSESGSSSGSGSISSPLRNLQDWYGLGGSVPSAYLDQVIVYRAGTFQYPFDPSIPGDLVWGAELQPYKHIGYPGEVVTWRGNPLSGRGFYNNLGGGTGRGIDDLFVVNLRFLEIGGGFRMNWTNNRHTWYNLKFEDMDLNRGWSVNSGTRDNLGGVIYLGPAPTVDVGIADVTFEGAQGIIGHTVNSCALEFYSSARVAIDDMTSIDLRVAHPIWFKNANIQWTITSQDYWQDGRSARSCFYHHNAWIRGGNQQPPDIGVSAEDSAMQVRYSRFYHTQRTNQGVFFYDTRHNVLFGHRHIDRCVFFRTWCGMPGVYTGWENRVEWWRCTYYVDPGWGDIRMEREQSLTDVIQGSESEGYLEYNLLTGQILNEERRYTHGWEIPVSGV